MPFLNNSLEIKSSTLSLALLGLILLLFGVLAVQTARGVTSVTIRGNVNKVIPGPKLQAVPNKQVTVVCGSVTKIATTSASGLYTAAFNEAGCNPFSAASTKAVIDGSTLTRQVFVSSGGQATIDLNF